MRRERHYAGGGETFFAARVSLLNVERLAGQRAVPTPAIAAAQQMFAVEQAKGREEDFSALIRTMEELAGVSAPPATSRNGGVGVA